MIKLNRKELVAALSTVTKANGYKKIPILNGVLFQYKDDKLTVTSSNGDVSIVKELKEFNTELKEFKFILEAKKVLALVKKFKSEYVTFEQEQEFIQVSDGRNTVGMKYATEYPKIPNDFGKKPLLTVNFNEFKELFQNVVYAVSKQESRPVLTGVNLRSNGNQIIAAATDSHRLAVATLDKEADEFEVNLYTQGLNIIMKEKDLSNISIYHSDKPGIYIKTDKADYYLRGIEGNYPNVDRLLPDSSSTELTFKSKKELLESIELANLTIDKKVVKDPCVGLDIDCQEVALISRNHQSSPFKGVLEAKLQGDPLKISFNPSYMKEALSKLEDREFTIYFNSSVRPIFVKQEFNSAAHLVTPIRTR